MVQRRNLLTWGLSSLAFTGTGASAALAATPTARAAAPAAAAASASAAQSYSGYVMGYFTESPSRLADDYGLHLAVSTDGLHWTPLNQNNPVVTPAEGTGGLRDPFIMRKQDGTFAVLATDLLGTDFTRPNQYIHAWDSAGLCDFTGYRRLKMHDMDTHTWAPEAFWDAAREQYGIIYSANDGGSDVLYVSYTTDFVTVSEPQLFFDPGFDVLDGTVHVGEGVNYLYYKSFVDGRLHGARSTTLDPGSFDEGTYTDGVVEGAIEAPIVSRANDGQQWHLWGDSFAPANGELYVWRSDDVATGTWSPLPKADYTQPLNAKHPTIAPITEEERTGMLATWGEPAWRRLKSYNHPDRLIRHADNAGRIDPYPFDPYPDSQWQLVPGLADPAAVSFRSVNVPGSYLRHLRQVDHALRLVEDDGSTAFAADATFHVTPGLAAGATWSSFRSHSVPDHYIRHADYVLRIDPLAEDSPVRDREDATFQIGY
jgi:hypothetical protein